MSSKYIRTFNELAKSQSGMGNDSDIKLWFEINENAKCDIKTTLSSIRKAFRLVGINGKNIVKRCFNATTVASQALIESKIKHTVTIGNLFFNGQPYYNTSKEIIEREFELGFSPTEPCNAHAWLTLENGTIIDFTVLSEIAKNNYKKAPNINKDIYVSTNIKYRKIKVSHVPYMLGVEFILRTTTPPNELSYQFGTMWAIRIDELLNEKEYITNH